TLSLQAHLHHHDLHSFPTRRSSDLKNVNIEHYEKLSEHVSQMERKAIEAERASVKYKQAEYLENQIGEKFKGIISGVTEWGMYRSEEHTSELQSRFDLVCRLLLEKK